MKKILLFVSILCGLTAYANDIDFQWAKTFVSPMGTSAHSLAKSADDKVFSFAGFGSSGAADSLSYGETLIGHGAPYDGSSSSRKLKHRIPKIRKKRRSCLVCI